MKIEILTNDLILGNFRASDYGLKIGSFHYAGESEDEIGMNISTIEEYVGHNPKPIYLDHKYTDKLRIQITLIKDPYVFNNQLHFSEKDCRSILRVLTGQKCYQWVKLIAYEPDEDLWYRAKVNNVSYERIGGHIIGIVLNFECDSCFAWSGENTITINAKAHRHFYVFNNTDDLNSYVYPTVSILSSSAGNLRITNISDNNWCAEIKNVKAGERITIDSQHQIISSNLPHGLLLDDFNLKWFRMIPDKNEYVSDSDIAITIKFRVPRKVGVIE